jgi:hypothetical protein
LASAFAEAGQAAAGVLSQTWCAAAPEGVLREYQAVHTMISFLVELVTVHFFD